MRPFGCVAVGLSLFLIVIMPFVFAQVLSTALLKLHLSPAAALAVIFGILFGGLVNIPVKRIVREEPVVMHPLAIYGLWGLFPRLQQTRRETIVAVNVGGCLIPTTLAAYEATHLLAQSASLLVALILAVMLNVGVCYVLARPVPGLGITMPTLIPPLVAALSALILAGEQAVPVAFISGVTGPLVGADLLHMRDIERIGAGIVSIGGAGTFDGIVLSGIVATYLA